jgi:hypothetical protein
VLNTPIITNFNHFYIFYIFVDSGGDRLESLANFTYTDGSRSFQTKIVCFFNRPGTLDPDRARNDTIIFFEAGLLLLQETSGSDKHIYERTTATTDVGIPPLLMFFC